MQYKPPHSLPSYLPSYAQAKRRGARYRDKAYYRETMAAYGLTLPGDDGSWEAMDALFSAPASTTDPLQPAPYARYICELGFGGGEHLVTQATQQPETGFIGCEPFIQGVAACAREVHARELRNIRLYEGDGRDLLARLPDDSLDRLFVLFPDPWPKKRHHKRRLINPDTLTRFAHVLKPGGQLRIATDHAGYAEWMLRHLLECPDFTWTAHCARDWEQPPEDWVPTRYERKACAAGRTPVWLDFRCDKGILS